MAASTTTTDCYSKWNRLLDELTDSDCDPAADTENTQHVKEREKRLIEQHLADIEDTKRRLHGKQHHTQFIQSIIDTKAARHVCNKAVGELTPICIWQLRPNTIHYGYKLIAKIVTPPDKLLSLRTIIKDVENSNSNMHSTVIQLSIYNLVPFQRSLSEIERQKLLCKHTVIIIKEPYCKIDKSKRRSLRIDNPYYNLSVLHADGLTLTGKLQIESTTQNSAESLKNAGNECFKHGKYWKALWFYSEALNVSAQHTENTVMTLHVLLNRSLAYLKLNEFHLAFIDAQNAYTQATNIKLDATSSTLATKVRYRYLCCLNMMGKYHEALSMLQGMHGMLAQLASNSIRAEFEKLTQSIARRRNEQHGKYESVSYELMAARNPAQWQSVADFIGNIDIRMIDSSKGRGMVATKHIQRGELILVEKAFSFGCYDANDTKQSMFVQTFNEECKRAYSGRNQELILDTLSKCLPFDYTHYCAESAYDMKDWHGSQSMRCVLNKWKLLQLYDGDSEKKCRPIERRMMEILSSSDIVRWRNKSEIAEIGEQAVSAHTVNEIILANAFESLMKPEHVQYFADAEQDENEFDVLGNERYCGCGLWIVASLFNHGDAPNAHRCVFYKTMLIKAKRDIKQGEEITISYVDQAMSAPHRQTQLRDWGI